jgi:hypothetical protein
MANRKSKNVRLDRSSETQRRNRTRMLQIVVVIFSILLILSMVLSLTSSF